MKIKSDTFKGENLELLVHYRTINKVSCIICNSKENSEDRSSISPPLFGNMMSLVFKKIK